MTQYARFEEHRADGESGAGAAAGRPYQARRRTTVRVLVPVAIAAVAAAGIGLVPALASTGTPNLPQVTAEQLIAKALGNQTTALSGTVQVSTDLGIPAQLLGTLGQGGAAGAGDAAAAAGSGGQNRLDGRGPGGADASPQAKLTTLLAGDHTLRVSADGPDKQRVALVESLAEYDLIHNGDQLWAWDSASNQAVHLSAPKGGAGAEAHKQGVPLTGVPTTPQEAAQQFLTASAGSSQVTVAGTVSVAGRDAYQLSVKPKGTGSTIGEVKIAVDAANGTPLSVVATSNSGSTVLDVHFSQVSFATPDAKTFDFTPPKGATVTEQGAAQQKAPKQPEGTKPQDKAGLNVIGSDWTTVVSFQLPSDLGGAGNAAIGNTAQGKKGRQQKLPSASAMIKSLGKPVAGGTLISTKVLNVLVTDDGKIFAGAVTLPVLQSAAGVK